MNHIIGVDLGTKNTVFYSKNKGILLNEPSVVAVHPKSKTVLAVGEEAREMLGKTPEHVTVIKPLSGGVITDFDVTRVMLKLFLEKTFRGKIFRPQVTVCVPSGITEVERRAVIEAVERSGGKNVYVMEEVMAAAIGAGLPVEKAEGSMIVDIGGGTADVAVLSFGGIVVAKSVRRAGDAMDEEIRRFVKEKYGVLIGLKTAETIKISVGAAHISAEEKSLCVMGRELSSGLPKNVTVTTSDVREAIQGTVGTILDAVKTVLEKTPPELVADIVENGIVLTGGGAKTEGLAQLIKEATGISSYVAENAELCVSFGAGMAMDTLFGGYFLKKEKSLFQSRS